MARWILPAIALGLSSCATPGGVDLGLDTPPAEPAQARSGPSLQLVCPGLRSDVVGVLRRRYDETQAGVGMERRGLLTELFTSPDGSTWTLIVTAPNGATCLVLTGQHWRAVPQGVES